MPAKRPLRPTDVEDDPAYEDAEQYVRHDQRLIWLTDPQQVLSFICGVGLSTTWASGFSESKMSFKLDHASPRTEHEPCELTFCSQETFLEAVKLGKKKVHQYYHTAIAEALHSPTEISKTMAKAGLKAALAHPTAKLWAGANHVDNFTIVIAREIENAILDVATADLENQAYLAWFENYLRDAPKHRPCYKGDTRSPCNSPFNRAIAAEAYAKLREGMPAWAPPST